MINWYLIHTKIRQEQLAMENLVLQNFECFLPQIKTEKLLQGQLLVVQEALFPRYLFIKLDTDLESQSWAPIRSTIGVCRVVTFGLIPAKINDDLVSAIRSQTETSEVQLRDFQTGKAVFVTEGPFADLEAIYQITDGESRVLVLLNLMSKPVKMSISPSRLQKVN